MSVVTYPGWLALTLILALPTVGRATEGKPGAGLQEIPDPELNLMRGRYTVGGNAVAWFGVTMISTWQTTSGQQLQGALTFGMDFTKGGTPRVSFTPSVNITSADAAMPDRGAGQRSIESAGLANVSGLTQSVQIAGDGNVARNVLHLNVRDDGQPGTDVGAGSSSSAAVVQGGSSATAEFNGQRGSVSLHIEGHGAVQQWMRSGSVGQSIQLTADGQQVSNRLQIDLVRQSLSANAPLAQNVAQAITLARGIGGGPGQ